MNRSALALLGGLLLTAGCTVRPPVGPTVLAVPPEGKSLAEFQQEEANCRTYATEQTGVTPAQGANQSAAGSAALGTVLGAAAGALLGAAGGSPGTGAAIGAGTGLLGGSAVGAGTAQSSSYGLQSRYDTAYVQCMASNGNRVQTAGAGPGGAYGAPYGSYAGGYSPYYGPYSSPYYGGYFGSPGFYRPGVSLGLGFGSGFYY